MVGFQKLGVMIDCSRNAVITKEAFCKMVDVLAPLGYDNIRLYMEDTYEVEGEPCFGYMRGRYSVTELQEMDAYAKSKGMELIPHIQTLAHLNSIFRYKDYIPINDTADILLVGEERTYELIENMFRTLSKAFTSRTVNIGMDEAFLLGRGKYFNKHGAEKSETIMRKHLDSVLAIAEKYGFTCEMWGDMFVNAAYPEKDVDNAASVRMEIPKNVRLVCWDYYQTERKGYCANLDRYLKLTENLSFAGGAWTWMGFCPNNSYAIAATRAAMQACKEKGIEDFYLTLWGDNGGECSPFAALPTLVYAAELAKGNDDLPSIKRKFQEVVGADYDLFMALELPDRIFTAAEKVDQCNPAKAIFYTDVFTGVYDKRVAGTRSAEYYRSVAEKLQGGVSDSRWGKLFRFGVKLCDVLEIKFELGARTRLSYQKGKEEVKVFAQKDYTALIERLEAFYEAYEELWRSEKKPHGFDVQDARIGGLIQRIKHCQKRLLRYANGEVERIPELEEELRNAFGYEKIEGILYNNYSVLYTVNVT